ncbi:MAG: DUF167 domain-containing protein [Rickettsiales bacterium]
MFILVKVKTNQSQDNIKQIQLDNNYLETLLNNNFINLNNLSYVFEIAVKDNPENNKANNKVIKLLAKFLKTQQDKIKIIKGNTTKIKLIKIIF